MQIPPRLSKSWRAFVELLQVWTHLTPEWRLPALTLALALGIMTQAVVVRAQDGGTGSGQLLRVSYELEVDTRGLTQNRFCLGRTVSLPLNIVAYVSVQGDVATGPAELRRATFTTTVRNPDVIRAQAAMAPLGSSLEAPFSAHLDLTGLKTGRATIEVSATVESSTRLSFNDEVALPIVTSGQTPTASVEVQVVPCEYRVDVGSVWVTSLWRATTWISAETVNVRLSSTTGTTYDTSAIPANRPGYKWRSLMNRIRGCLVSDQDWSFYSPPMRGEVLGDSISLSIAYSRVVPPESYYRRLCRIPPGITPGDCPSYPDRVCFVSRRPEGDWFEPKSPTDPLIFPVEGGTIRVPQDLVHPEGRATGSITITLTPILP